MFIEGLKKMLLRMEVVTLNDNPQAVLVFAVGCAIVGIAAVILDLSFYILSGQSLLKLKHGKYTFLFLIAWSIGSLIIGYLGQMAKIFQVSLLACVAVGFTWPIIFTEILSKYKQKEAQAEPEQAFGEEE